MFFIQLTLVSVFFFRFYNIFCCGLLLINICIRLINIYTQMYIFTISFMYIYILCVLPFLIIRINHNLHSLFVIFHFNLFNQKYHSLLASYFFHEICLTLSAFFSSTFPLWRTNCCLNKNNKHKNYIYI